MRPVIRSRRPVSPRSGLRRWRELLDVVKQMNKTRKVRIDVITIRDGHTGFATDLAEENRGQYLSVD